MTTTNDRRARAINVSSLSSAELDERIVQYGLSMSHATLLSRDVKIQLLNSLPPKTGALSATKQINLDGHQIGTDLLLGVENEDWEMATFDSTTVVYVATRSSDEARLSLKYDLSSFQSNLQPGHSFDILRYNRESGTVTLETEDETILATFRLDGYRLSCVP